MACFMTFGEGIFPGSFCFECLIYIDEFSFCGPCVDAEQITDLKIGLFCVVVGYFVQDI